MLEDLRRHRGDVLELHAGQLDAGLLLVPVHHRISQASLTPEVAVDGPLVDAGPFGHGPDGQPLPVPDRRPVQELGAGDDDPLPRLRGPLATQGAVVGPAGSRRGIRWQLGSGHGAHSVTPAWPTIPRRPG